MTPELLINALCDFLEQVARTFSLETDQGNFQAPRVFKYDLPDKQTDVEPEYPFVIVRLMGGEDTEEESIAHIKLIFGAYHQESEGMVDISNFMERARQALFKKRTLDNKFRIEFPYTWNLFEEQPSPYWLGQSISKWIIQKVEEEVIWNG